MLYRIFSKIKSWFGLPYFTSRDVQIGRNVRFGRNCRFHCERVRIGDGCIFHDNVRVNATEFVVGDYATIYHDNFFPGPGRLRIGHNFWLGNNCVVDASGDTTIGHNVGIGAHSQLWGHIGFGDVMLGSQFDATGALRIGDDVWLVGHNLVSPVSIGARSLAMLGSLVTKNIPADQTWAGSPATDMTAKFGSPIAPTSLDFRRKYLKEQLEQFGEMHRLDIWKHAVIIENEEDRVSDGRIFFNTQNRTYNKTNSHLEHALIRFLLPKAKFTPLEPAQ